MGLKTRTKNCHSDYSKKLELQVWEMAGDINVR